MNRQCNKNLQTLAVIAACIPATLLLQTLHFSAQTGWPVRVLLCAACYALIAAPVIIYCAVKKISPADLGIAGKHWLKNNLFGALLAGVVLFAGVPFLRLLFGADYSPGVNGADAAVVAVAAFAEEFMFRGFLQRRLCAFIGKPAGYFLSCACFAAFHIPRLAFAGASAEYTALYCGAVFMGSLVFGGLALLFDDVWPSVWVHTAANIVLAAV